MDYLVLILIMLGIGVLPIYNFVCGAAANPFIFAMGVVAVIALTFSALCFLMHWSGKGGE